jgi:hypothetical protein
MTLKEDYSKLCQKLAYSEKYQEMVVSVEENKSLNILRWEMTEDIPKLLKRMETTSDDMQKEFCRISCVCALRRADRMIKQLGL